MSNCGIGNDFDNINSLSDYSLLAQVEENLKAYLDNGFLSIGGFVNCVSGTGLYGEVNTKVTQAEVINYTKGTVWETNHKEWVYETGVCYSGSYPIPVSGIYVNNIFLPSPTGSGSYGYSLNYPNGQITFKRSIPPTSNIRLNYSYKKIQVYKASTTNWWGEFKSAVYSDLPNEYSIHMPAIIIEPAPQTTMKPYQLGDRSFFTDQDFLLYIFAESAIERNNISDIIRFQKERTLLTYDINRVIKDGVYPINFDGSVNNSGQSYNSLLTNYRGPNLFIKNIAQIGMETYSKKLFWCILRITTQTIV